MKVANNIIELIGKTPLVRLNKVAAAGKAELLAKVEFFNPGGSVKDRIALGMIEDAEKAGIIKPGSVIIEPTSGNTGIGLALVAAVKGYKLILTMPETMTMERRKIVQAYGAELVLTPGHLGMAGAVAKAEELVKEMDNAFMPMQFDNPSNPAKHMKTTAVEIWEDTDGHVDVFVAGVGSAGTVVGVSEELKKRNPNVKTIAVEPLESPVLSGGKPGPHKIQGIGAGFIPGNYKSEVIDEIICVPGDEAIATAKRLASEEGLFVGISAGAALWAALKVAQREEMANKKIVVLLPDTGERYLSTW